MSVSQQHLTAPSLKRDHHGLLLKRTERQLSPPIPSLESRDTNQLESRDDVENATVDDIRPSTPTSLNARIRDPSPAKSSTGSLTDAGSVTPPRSVTPSITTAPDGAMGPPPKKVKPTVAEKELKRLNKEAKDRERAEEKAKKDAERRAHAEEKVQKDAAKEEKRRKKEEERRRREEDKQRAEEEKKKKDRSQGKLNSFFSMPARSAEKKSSTRERNSASPAPAIISLGTPTVNPAPSKAEVSYYDQTFPPFFVQANVTVAPINRFERDEQASENQKRTIDSYLQGDRSPDRQHPFDAISLFHLVGRRVRGKRFVSVRQIMSEASGNSSRPIDLTTDSQNSQIKKTNDILKAIPYKFLMFQEDVRPPYRGTYTSQPVNGMMRLARNPLRRDLPDTNYDYDSEAEWIEDEDAEDLNSEGEEDDADPDDAEDMDGFLDDENDELVNSKRLVLQGDLEPISSGLCWEDKQQKNTDLKMTQYRMETILDEKLKSIDPFSSHYWEPVRTKATAMAPRLPLNTLKSNNLPLSGFYPNTNKPVKPFFAPASDSLHIPPGQSQLSPPSLTSGLQRATNKPKEKKLIPQEHWASFREEVEGSNLSKVGLIEVLKKKFPKATGGMVKATLEAVAQRVGKKESEKRWTIIGAGVE